MRALFDFARRRVSGLGDDAIFDRLPFFVRYAQRFAGSRIDKLNLDLAKFSVACLVRGLIADLVLIAQRLRDGAVDARKFAVEPREIRLPARLCSKSAHLI